MKRPSANIMATGSSSQQPSAASAARWRGNAGKPISGSTPAIASHGQSGSGTSRSGPKSSVRRVRAMPSTRPIATPPLGQFSTRSTAVGSQGRKSSTSHQVRQDKAQQARAGLCKGGWPAAGRNTPPSHHTT